MDIQLPDRLHGIITADTETKDPDLLNTGAAWAFPGRGYVVGYSIHADNFHEYLPVRHEGGGNMDPVRVESWLKHVMGFEDQEKVFAHGSYDYGWMKYHGIDIKGRLHDVQFQAPLLDEHRFSYSLDNLAKDYLGLDMGKSYFELNLAAQRRGLKEKEAVANLWRFHGDEVRPYALQDSLATRQLFDLFTPKIVEEELEKVYKLECDLIPLIVAMRMKGVRVNLDRVEQLQAKYLKIEQEAIDLVKKETGVSISLTETQTIAAALETFGVEFERTPKSGLKKVTDEILEALSKRVPLAGIINHAKKINKARKTFLESSILGHQHNGRIHTTLNQLKADKEEGKKTKGTVSGRFSSNSPNLQQIPARDVEIGPDIRGCYEAEEGCLWGTHDFSQQEPRGIVTMAYETYLKQPANYKLKSSEILVKRYRENPETDFYTFVSEMTGLPRKRSKIVALGIAYGQGAGALAEDLGLPWEWSSFKKGDKLIQFQKAGPEAKELLAKFDQEAPFIRELAKICKKIADTRGWIRTPDGRRSRFPIFPGSTERARTNKALNALIQPFAADENKRAMLMMYQEGIIPVLTVHDEVDRTDGETPEDYRRSVEIMLEAQPKCVPSKVDLECGPNWGSIVKYNLKTHQYEAEAK